jgi:TPR repeat protein
MPPAAMWALMLVAARALGQGAAAPPSTSDLPSAPAVDVSATSERRLHTAFDHLYNLDFDAALQIFADVTDAEPNSAAVTAFWSCALLYEMLAQQGSLESQLFVANAFLRDSPPPVDPELDAQYLSVREEAERRAERRLGENADDVDALFALGLVYGNAANYLAGIKGQYFGGLRLGERAFDIHSDLRAMRPDIHDTGLVLGVREYVIGTLPRTIRFLLYFIGANGDRERGLAYMREAAEQGTFLAPYAQVLLAMASIRDHNLTTATSLAEDLIDRYPRNPLLRLELTKLYRQQGRFEPAARLVRELLDELATAPPDDALLADIRDKTLLERERIALRQR